tara:strand:- start:389 stop:715 length:327 start_codon:yes stop_codon:yes gene_type:complete
MERKSKRKATNFEFSEPKRIKNESYIIVNLELIVCEKIRENEELKKLVNKLEKKIKRVEKFNEQLRIKNTKLEEELLDEREKEKELEICQELNNLNVKPSNKFIDYIN